jgi:hypothetical protein
MLQKAEASHVPHQIRQAGTTPTYNFSSANYRPYLVLHFPPSPANFFAQARSSANIVFTNSGALFSPSWSCASAFSNANAACKVTLFFSSSSSSSPSPQLSNWSLLMVGSLSLITCSQTNPSSHSCLRVEGYAGGRFETLPQSWTRVVVLLTRAMREGAGTLLARPKRRRSNRLSSTSGAWVDVRYTGVGELQSTLANFAVSVSMNPIICQ